jgi:hypothetical protein
MTLGRRGYIDLATYWTAPTENGYGGVSFGTPVLIQTKWEDRIEEFTDFRGTDSQSKSVVFVLQDMDEGGYLALGDHVTVPVEDPTTLGNAYYIKRVDKIRDLRGLHEEITVYL